MSENSEKLELAHLITVTEGLLKRIRMRQICWDTGPGNAPALTPRQCQMVMLVHEQGSMTVRQLTQALYVNAPAVSTMVERLVEMGILTREENPKDRREDWYGFPRPMVRRSRRSNGSFCKRCWTFLRRLEWSTRGCGGPYASGFKRSWKRPVDTFQTTGPVGGCCSRLGK